jgi:hypothetical protein
MAPPYKITGPLPTGRTGNLTWDEKDKAGEAVRQSPELWAMFRAHYDDAQWPTGFHYLLQETVKAVFPNADLADVAFIGSTLRGVAAKEVEAEQPKSAGTS